MSTNRCPVSRPCQCWVSSCRNIVELYFYLSKLLYNTIFKLHQVCWHWLLTEWYKVRTTLGIMYKFDNVFMLFDNRINMRVWNLDCWSMCAVLALNILWLGCVHSLMLCTSPTFSLSLAILFDDLLNCVNNSYEILQIAAPREGTLRCCSSPTLLWNLKKDDLNTCNMLLPCEIP